MPTPNPSDPHTHSLSLTDDGPVSPRILDAVLEAAEMGTWRYTVDDRRCYCSPRAQMLYGLDTAYFVRDDATVARMLHPDDIPIVEAALARACGDGGDGRYVAEYRVRRLEGGWRWLSVWGLVTFSGDGAARRPHTITGGSRDITDRKKADAFLHAQKRSLEMVATGAPLSDILTYLTRVVERQSDDQAVAAILLLDEDGRLRNGAAPSLPETYNAAIDGLKADPLVGTCSAAAATCRTVITPDIEQDAGWAAIRHLPLDLGLRAAWSQPITARDGHVLGTFGTYFRTCRTPTVQERESVEILARTAALAIERVRDEEALRASEARLREEDRRKDEFLAALSHELRNPLAPLQTAVHLLRAHDEPDTRGRVIVRMERQLGQLIRLVDDLLQVSRITRGTLSLSTERLDLAEVIDLAVETSEPHIQAASHHLAIDLPGEPLWVLGDRVRLAQILSNLLNNAAKYTDAGGRIVVRATSRGALAEVSVRDTGAGIDPAAMAKLFDLFVRGPQAARSNQDGLGIGLALARRLAELHGGELEGRSDGPGRGSEFILRVPLLAVATVPVPLHAPAQEPPRRITPHQAF